MKKPAIVVPPCDSGIRNALISIKENIEDLTGRRGGKVATLASSAALSDVINKVNELINRFQG